MVNIENLMLAISASLAGVSVGVEGIITCIYAVQKKNHLIFFIFRYVVALYDILVY